MKSCLSPLFSHAANAFISTLKVCLKSDFVSAPPSPAHAQAPSHLASVTTTPSHCSALPSLSHLDLFSTQSHPKCHILSLSCSKLASSFSPQKIRAQKKTVLTRSNSVWSHLSLPTPPSSSPSSSHTPVSGPLFHCALCLECFSPDIHMACSLTSCRTSLRGYFAGDVFPDHPKRRPLPHSVPTQLYFIFTVTLSPSNILYILIIWFFVSLPLECITRAECFVLFCFVLFSV